MTSEAGTRFTEPYLYRLVIANHTRRDLVPRDIQLRYGVWRRDGMDGAMPVIVPAGATVEALAIRAGTSPNKGYACRCAWIQEAAGGEPEGRLALFIGVPFMGGRNKAGLDVSGALAVSGWTGVSTIGHRFEHTLTVTNTL